MSAAKQVNGLGKADSNAAATLQRIRAARIDGRASQIRYRQDQLQQLHRCLVSHVGDIRRALGEDTGNSLAECSVEFSMATAAVRAHYESLDFEQTLRDEYRPSRGEDFATRRVAVGIVTIRPEKTSPLFSTVAPLSAAIAAGNCVVIELSQNLMSLTSLLRNILPKALDRDSFAIVDQGIEDATFMADCLQVIQTGSASIANCTYRPLESRSSRRVVAVVDRTADINNATEALIRSRFCFGGHAAYAPDLVLVNEFIKKPFLEALVRQAVAYTTSVPGSTTTGAKPRAGKEEPVKEAVTNISGASIVSLAPGGAILDVTSRNSSILKSKVELPLLPVLSVSSLDDAIDFVNAESDNTGLLAAHVFGNAGAVKYLSQFIIAEASLINQIPPELLVGPAGPAHHPLSIELRYTQDMFEISSPQFANGTPRSQLLSTCLRPAADSVAESAALTRDALNPLKPTGQSLNAHIGFFEQGILTGLAVFGSPIVIGLGWGTYYLARRFIIPRII